MRLLVYLALAAPLALSAVVGTAIASSPSVYDFAVKRIDGKPTKLSAYKGKVLLIVNTASKCGFTPQYEGLEKVHKAYNKRGLAVMGFPSNDFGGQEPGSNKDIHGFCTENYGVTFDMFEKVAVRGAGQASLFQFLTASPPKPAPISWNFEKFLISRQGTLVARYGSFTKPEDDKLKAAIEAELAKR